ncbi:MAG: type II secretion system F family protein [Pseudomonadota bacterium]
MPEFVYHAVDRNGRASDGSMVADDIQLLEQRLREIGYWLVDAKQQTSKRSGRRQAVPRRELIDLFTGLTSLQIAGIPIADALDAMAEEIEHRTLRDIVSDVAMNVKSGNDLSSSFRKFPRVFSEQVCNLIQAGEAGGNLVDTFRDLAAHLEWVDRIVADVKQASIYPIMIISAVAGLIGLMFTVVVPRFAKIFAELDITMPALTQAVISIGEFAASYWWIVILGLLMTAISYRVLRSTNRAFGLAVDRLKLSMPVFGGIQRLLVQSQFVHNLALMLKAGVPILDALRLSKGLTNNLVMDTAISEATEAVRRGDKISDALRQHDIVSSLTLRMIVVGEESGRLDTTLQQVAERFDEEIPRQIKRVFAILEPMITLTLVGIVGLIAASIFLPMFSLITGLG